MRRVLTCRRTFIALLALVALVTISLYNQIDTSMAIASVAIGLAGSNAAEAAMRPKNGPV